MCENKCAVLPRLAPPAILSNLSYRFSGRINLYKQKRAGFCHMNIKKVSVILIAAAFLFFPIPRQTAEAAISVSARNAILMEQDSGRILFEKKAHEKRRIASITKIMTAIIAIESDKLDEVVTVSERAVGIEGSSLYLKKNEKIKLEDLVYGLMLRSGNDAAVAIAEHVGGSVEGFVFLMNQKAQELGMTNTRFANPHGLDDSPDHYSTAYDMAVLTRYAMQNETYRKIAGTKVHRVPHPDENWDRVWKNKNRLIMGKYEYATGGKTGYTKLAKRTLVSTATKGDMNLIAVTLNAPDDWNDHINMYETAFKNYEMAKILPAGPIKNIDDPFYKGKIYIAQDVFYPVAENEKDLFRVKYQLLNPDKVMTQKRQWPDIAGKAIVYFNNQRVKEVPVYLDQSKLENPSFFDRFKKIFNSVIGVDIYG